MFKSIIAHKNRLYCYNITIVYYNLYIICNNITYYIIA